MPSSGYFTPRLKELRATYQAVNRIQAKISSISAKIWLPLETEVVGVAQYLVSILSHTVNSVHGIQDEELIRDVGKAICDIEKSVDAAATDHTLQPSNLCSQLSELLAQMSTHLAHLIANEIRVAGMSMVSENTFREKLQMGTSAISLLSLQKLGDIGNRYNQVKVFVGRRSLLGERRLRYHWEKSFLSFDDIDFKIRIPEESLYCGPLVSVADLIAPPSNGLHTDRVKKICYASGLGRAEPKLLLIGQTTHLQPDEVEAEAYKSGCRVLLQRCLRPPGFTRNQRKQYMKQLERWMEMLRLFPIDYEFDKQQLLHLWKADATAVSESEPDLAELTLMEVYFEWLVSERYIYSSNCSVSYKLNREKVKLKVQIKQGYFILDSKTKHEAAPAEVIHLSVQDDDLDDSLIMALADRGLRTLLFNATQSSTLEKMLLQIFLKCDSLLVLDLSGTAITELPSSFAKMTRLRYLDLSWTLIELLPESICSFEDLETLRLKGCSNIWRLPRDFKRLTKLRHLEFDVLGQLSVMPEGFSSLVNIETLTAFLVGVQKRCGIVELEKLNSISSEFCIAMLENVTSVEDAKAARLQDKKDVKNLELRWSDDTTLQDGIDSNGVLESLRPNTELEELHIQFYGGTDLPSWIGDGAFCKLSSITLFECEHVIALPSLWKLRSLEYLRLTCLASVKVLDFSCESGDEIAFPKLQTVIIEEMLLLQDWRVTDGDCPCLADLTIRDCPNLSKLPEKIVQKIKKIWLEEGSQFNDNSKHIPDVCIVEDDDVKEEDGYELVTI